MCLERRKAIDPVPERDDTEAHFKAATRGIEGPPLRWDRIARRTRRRQVLALLGLVATTVLVAVLLAGGLLAGKKAVDPTYHPPFLSSASSSLHFAGHGPDRGHTRLVDYLHAEGRPSRGLSSAELRREGFVFHTGVELKGYGRRTLKLQWTLQTAASARTVSVPTYGDAALTPRVNDYRRKVGVWIAAPSRSGTYTVNFTLRDAAGKTIDHARSKPFFFLAPTYFVRYRARTYTARVPAGWHFTERDAPQPLHRRVTQLTGPGSISVLIDTTPNTSGDPAISAKTVESLTRGIPGYHRLEFTRTTLGRNDVFEWSWQVGTLRHTDILFYRGGDGFGVRADGPGRRFTEIRTVAREVARSVTPR